MKKLKVLIIADDEASLLNSVKFIAEMFSKLKLSAGFSYIKSFDEALARKDSLLQGNGYDLICLATDWPDTKAGNVSEMFDLVEYFFLKISLPSTSLSSSEKKEQQFYLYFLTSSNGDNLSQARAGIIKYLS